MHELGILFEVIQRVAPLAYDNGVDRIRKLTLEIGEASSVVPEYIEKLYPDACVGTPLEDSELEIVTVPAVGKCKVCGTEYLVVPHSGVCPHCTLSNYSIVAGKDFRIKEIAIPEIME